MIKLQNEEITLVLPHCIRERFLHYNQIERDSVNSSFSSFQV